MKHSAKHLFEYICLRLAGAWLFILPQPAAKALAWLAARIMFHGLRYRRTEAERRIISVLNCSPEQAKKIAWGSMFNLCLMSIEALRASPRRIRKLGKQPAGIAYEKMYATHKARFGTRGLIIAGPHMGCWEQAGLAGQAAGIPLFFLAKRQKNRLTDSYLNKKRSTTGSPPILNDSKVLKTIIRRLNNGEAMAILPDISEKSRKVLQVNFLGGTANLNPGAAMFARQTGVPIYPACSIYSGGKHRILFADQPIIPDESLSKHEDYQRMMQQMFDFFNEQILRHPEQYFWYNKRWILEPPKSR